MWSEIIGGVLKPIGEYFGRRQELKAEEHRLAIELVRAEGERRKELILAGLTADMNWEMEFARQAQTSWKDEYTLLVTSLPAVLCFVPGGAQYVHRGFQALSEAPIWYTTVLLSMFLATVGIRYWRRTQSDT
jgi:hypothetical protein